MFPSTRKQIKFFQIISWNHTLLEITRALPGNWIMMLFYFFFPKCNSVTSNLTVMHHYPSHLPNITLFKNTVINGFLSDEKWKGQISEDKWDKSAAVYQTLSCQIFFSLSENLPIICAKLFFCVCMFRLYSPDYFELPCLVKSNWNHARKGKRESTEKD